MSDAPPASESPGSLALVDLVDRACDAFEGAWRAGDRPRIEAFLADAPPAARDDLLRELLLLELDLARGDGQAVDRDGLHARFPADAVLLESVWREVDAAQPTLAGPASADGRSRPELPGYILLDELGRGGMGVVYRARDVRLNRVVALKMVLGGILAPPEYFARFQAEAETIARLQHPNVVRIHGVGEHQGVPFLDMEYLAGGSLAARLDGTPWPPRTSAQLVEALARGVEAIHRVGVVHRDLKPGNVLIADDGTPRLADFGLAMSLSDDQQLTRTGAVIGSPSYMAPEQAHGAAREAGPAVDVYALGAVLYELLTGRPPFRAATVHETLSLVRSSEPIAPSRLVPGLPRDIETVALKCLEKSPARRYATAAALADDLARFLDHRPVAARRIGPAGRLVRWCRRSPRVAGLTAVVFLLLLTVTAVSLGAALREAASAAKERRTLYFARMNLVQQAWEAADVARMNALLAPYTSDTELRGFEWHYWWRMAHRPAATLTGHRREILAAVFSPDGRTLATAEADTVRLWDVASRRSRGAAVVPATVRCLAFSPDGARVAVGVDDGSIRLLDAATGTLGPALPEIVEPIRALRFLDARTFVAACEPNIIRVCDVASGRMVRTVRGSVPPRPQVEDFHPLAHAISADGRRLAMAGFNGLIVVRETDARPPALPPALALAETVAGRLGRPIVRTPPPEDSFRVGDFTARSLAFSPDGLTLAVGGEDHAITLWDVAGRRESRVLRGHGASIWSLDFTPDGRTLVAASLDNTVTLWDAASGRLHLTLKGHGGPVMSVAVAPDGRTIAAGGFDARVTLWDAVPGGPDTPFAHPEKLDALALSPDGQTLATGARDGGILLWDTATGRRRLRIEPHSPAHPDGHPSHVRCLRFTPDGATLISGGWKSRPRFWDVATGAFRGELPASPGDDDHSRSLALTPDGRTLIVSCFNRRIELWDLPRRARLPLPAGLDRPGGLTLGLAPDGRTLATADGTSTLAVRDLTGARPPVLLTAPGFAFESLAFAPDGRVLAAGGSDGSLILWDTPTRQMLAVERAHSNALTALAFTPDGRTLATAGRDNAIRLWDAPTLELKSTLKGHTSNVMDLAFSADGRTLASASLDGTARLWLATPPGR